MIPSAIAALSAQQEAMTARLTRWAEINSGSTHAAGLARMAETLLADFRAAFPAAATEAVPLPGGLAPALSIRLRPEAPIQVLAGGHYDTVYDAGHAFQRCTRVDAATLRGPGVADMKGGLVVMLEALRAFEAAVAAGAAAPVGWHVLLTPDEETGSATSAALLMAEAPRHRLALVFEPARPNGDIVRARMGTGMLTVTCHGRAAHAGRDPRNGRNAIVALAEFLPQADALNRTLEGILLNVGSIRGGGAANIVPDFAEAEINFRVWRADDEAALRAALDRAAAPINAREGYRLEIAGRLNRPPKEVNATEEALFERWRRCAAETGVTLDWQNVGGGSDGNILAGAGLPCLDGLGPIGDHLHSPAETVHLPSLTQRAQIAALFLLNL